MASKNQTDASTSLVKDDPILAALLGTSELVIVDERTPAEVTADILGEIFSADDAESILGGSVTDLDDLLDVDLLLTDVSYNQSTFDDSESKVYAVLRVIDHDGRRMVTTTGAVDVVARARRLEVTGNLPCWVKVTKAEKPTKGGYYPRRMGPGRSPSGSKTGQPGEDRF